jgi:hypothetical protein
VRESRKVPYYTAPHTTPHTTFDLNKNRETLRQRKLPDAPGMRIHAFIYSFIDSFKVALMMSALPRSGNLAAFYIVFTACTWLEV